MNRLRLGRTGRVATALAAALAACHTTAAPRAPAGEAGAKRRVEPVVATPPAATAPLPPTAAAAGPFSLGINEALAVPMRFRKDLSSDRLAAMIEDDAGKVRTLGATWVRGHTANFPRTSCADLGATGPGYAEMDLWVKTLGPDLHGLAMLGPWPGNATANRTERYVPTDLPAYSACITALVERYDGDGVDDMPGLVQPVKYWEFDNEPDLKNSQVARDAVRDYDPTTFCTPTEYAKVLVTTRAAVRAADPTAKLLALGLYRPYSEQGQAYAKAVLAVPGAADAFDVASLHTYHDDDGDRLAGAIRTFRTLVPGKPIWITEASVTTATGEDDQGRRVAAYVAQAAAAGAERVFWHTLADPPARPSGRGGGHAPGGHFSTNSLLRGIEGGTEEKPAGAVYRHLAARLATDDLFDATLDGAGAAKLRSGAVLLFAGSRAAPAGGTDLRTGEALAAGATATAPAWLNAPPKP